MAVPDVIIYPRETLWWDRGFGNRINYVFVEGPIYQNRQTNVITALGQGLFLCLQPANIGGKPGAQFEFSSQQFKVNGMNSFAGTLTMSKILPGDRTLVVTSNANYSLSFFIGGREITARPKASIHFQIETSTFIPGTGKPSTNHITHR